ncbi:YecH family metal-binding protein [Acerihabitans arboris]|uniref:DUF2492 family protein n=1 Tax=Acerihabitans arboris TaxID=2691583 RepID=A0A845SNI1_9GAMM|nr:YecH family metal-binding protein [Acerihabitans arboris]NDL64942.1 DUF2492 family protein [Acerihabitans arboris]
MTSIHGHEVLHMMLATQESFTTNTLVAGIEARFGPDARFHTCSAADLDARALVDFLAARGKFVARDAGFTTGENKICQH